jgi:signal transduction histidine kinase
MRTLLLIALLAFSWPLFAQTKAIDSLQTALVSAKDKTKIQVLIDLCWEYRFINADSARAYGIEGLELARKSNLQSLEGDALHNIGITLEAQGNYHEALAYELPALEIRKKVGDDFKTANTLNNLGIIFDEMGDPKRALENYYEARNIYERLNDKSKIAMVISNIGIVLKEQREYEKVIGYYYEALSIYKDLKNDFGIAACHANLGSVFYFTQEYDSALYYSLLSTAEFRKQNVMQFLPTTLSSAAQAYHKLGKTKEAKASLLEAQALNEQFDNKFDLAEVLINLASVYRGEKKFKEARALGLRALSLAELIEAKKLIMDAHLELSAIEENGQNFSAALREYKFYNQQKDSLFQQEKTRQIAEMETQYETEKKERQIVQLQNETLTKDLELQSTRTMVWWIIAAVIFVSIAVLALLKRNQFKLRLARVKENEELQRQRFSAVIEAEENERARVAKDLHDGIGQLLSSAKLSLTAITLPPHDAQVQLLTNSIHVLDQATQEVRSISHNLMPSALIELGLKEALQDMVDKINESKLLNIKFSMVGIEARLQAAIEVSVYRVIQEVINNMIKHSKANKIEINLVGKENKLHLSISDNGVGFEKEMITKSKGLGWKSIFSRIAMLKGNIEVDTQPGKGTNINIQFAIA